MVYDSTAATLLCFESSSKVESLEKDWRADVKDPEGVTNEGVLGAVDKVEMGGSTIGETFPT